ncbi:MAG: glycosyltransferase, partial [Acidimicrobiales bacterium]
MTVPVLLVAPSATAGGSQKALFGLIRHLPALGYEPTVAVFEAGPLEGWLDGIGCPSERVPFGRLRNPIAVARTVLALRRLGRRVGARLIVDNMSIAHIYGGVAARLLRIPSIWWQQIIPNRDFGGPKMTRPVLDRAAALVPAAAIVVHSDAAITAQRELTPRRHVVKVHQGIDLGEVRAFAGQGRELRAGLGWDDRTIIGIVGWLLGWKGQDVFLRAAARVARSHPD